MNQCPNCGRDTRMSLGLCQPCADEDLALQRDEIGRSHDEIFKLEKLLERALPMLVRLGDFIGNGEIDPKRDGSLGERCDLIGDIKEHFRAAYA